MANELKNPVGSVRERHRLLKYALAFLMISFCLCESFLAGQFYIIYKGDWVTYFGPKRIGPYATREEAEAVWKKMCSQPDGVGESAKRNTYIDGTPTGGGANQSSLSPYYSGDDPRLQLFGALLGYIFAKPADTSAKDALAKQKEEERKREEERIEAARKEKQDAQNAAALEDWRRQQESEKAEREKREKERWKQSEDLLGKIGAVGGDAAASSPTIKPIGTDFFGTGGPTGAKLRTSGPGQFPTSGFTALQSLQASADFLLNAAAATGGGNPDYEEAVFLAQQADKVIQRQPTNVKSRFAAPPDAPAAPDPRVVAALNQKMVVLASSIGKSVEAIQATEIKIAEIDVEVKAVERKKETAQVKLKEAEAKVVAAKPEEKAQAEDFAKQAQLLLQEANAQEEKYRQDKAAFLDEKEKQAADLKKINQELKEIENQLKNLGK